MKNSLQNHFTLLGLFILIIIYSERINAQENNHENIAQELSDQIMSPYCPGRTLSACPSDDARKLRQQISHQLSQGYSKDAVTRQLIGIYGKEILGKPAYKGFGITAWILPIIVVISSLITTILFISKNKSRKKVSDKVNYNNLESALINKAKQE